MTPTKDILRSGTSQFWQVTLIVLLAVTGTFASQTEASDQHALNAIFAEQHVEDSALDVHRRAMQMPEKDRYRFLAEWILPGVDHDTLRMSMGFSQTNPAPMTVGQVSNLSAQLEKLSCDQDAGGEILSPVFDLLDVARKLDRLGELQDRLDEWHPDKHDDRLSRSAMLTLIELARGGVDAAAVELERLLRITSDESVVAGPTSAELLVFQRGLDDPRLHDPIVDALQRYYPWVIAEYERSTRRRHVSAMLGRVRALQRASTGDDATSVSRRPMKQWFPVSRATSQTRGHGSPVPRWDFRPGHVENICSHDEDYLYFALPLRGNFEVECDVTGFEWRDSHLLVGGTWVAPLYTHKGYDLGHFRRHRPRVEFSPPLTKVKDWIHYRTVVRDRIATTYFNGRKIHEERLTADHDPWLAIRSTQRHDGAVRNVRITGNPVIPEEVRLTVDVPLHGWIPYFDGPMIGGRDSVWKYATSIEAGGEVVGQVSNLSGIEGGQTIQNGQVGNLSYAATTSHHEALLRYHRPMLEDGTIEYEFFYFPGKVLTHPAIDRLALLLQPDGVRIHQVTDGAYEQSSLGPDNVHDEPKNRRGPDQLPLKPDDWNRMQFRLTGNTVTLILNGTVVYKRPLEPTNQRTFGLFFFADQTLARVRNVVWKGGWPRELPSLAEQELATDDTGFLDGDLDRLTAVFEHDFVNDGLPIDQFAVLRGGQGVDVKPTPEGLVASRKGTGGYQNSTIAPSLKVEGDFDIIARYDQFESSPSRSGSCSLMLFAILDNATADEGYVTRRHIHRSTGLQEQYMQCVTVQRFPEGDRRNYFGSVPAEERSGALRLARRGDQLYYLTAEGDSPHFQLRAQRTFPKDAIRAEGLRLIAQIHQPGGAIRVVWKDLSVRAEKLSGPAVEDFETRLVELNKSRDKLPARFTHDFSKHSPPFDEFHRWGVDRKWKAEDGGLTIVSAGSEEWTSTGSSILKQVTGDFDIVAQFDVQEFDKPKPGGRCSVYLQLEIPDEKNPQISMIFCNDDSEQTEVIAQAKQPLADGSYQYSPLGGIDLPSVTAMRIARRGGRLSLLVSSKHLKHERIVAQLDVSKTAIPRSHIRFFVHTGGADRESRVLWKSIDIRAEDMEPETTAADAPREKSVLETVLDFFK